MQWAVPRGYSLEWFGPCHNSRCPDCVQILCTVPCASDSDHSLAWHQVPGRSKHAACQGCAEVMAMTELQVKRIVVHHGIPGAFLRRCMRFPRTESSARRRLDVLSCFIVAVILMVSVTSPAAPGYGQPLTLTRGTVYPASTLAQLKQAVNAANSAGSPATILVSNGVYVLDVPTLNITCPGLVIRSASGDRETVVIRGPDEGPTASLQNVFSISATNVVIADLTFGYCRWHGIQVHGESAQNAAGLWVHNCHLVNCNEQFIKGSVGSGSVGARDGLIENCLFEFTSGWAYQYYTGGIDIY